MWNWTFPGWERLTSHRICFIDYMSCAPVTSSATATATLYLLEPLPSILVTLHTCNLEMSYFPALPTSLIMCWATLISCKMSFPSFLAFFLSLTMPAFLAPPTFAPGSSCFPHTTEIFPANSVHVTLAEVFLHFFQIAANGFLRPINNLG